MGHFVDKQFWMVSEPIGTVKNVFYMTTHKPVTNLGWLDHITIWIKTDYLKKFKLSGADCLWNNWPLPKQEL